MPNYKIQLKQGKRTLVAHGEFKNVASVLDHYHLLTTMKVSEILKVEYIDETTPPIDDFNYRSLYKGFLKNDTSRKSRQIVIQNLKLSKDELDIFNSAKINMEIDGLKVDSVTSSLFKK